MYTKLKSTGTINILINSSYLISIMNAKMRNSGILHLRALITVILSLFGCFSPVDWLLYRF